MCVCVCVGNVRKSLRPPPLRSAMFFSRPIQSTIIEHIYVHVKNTYQTPLCSREYISHYYYIIFIIAMKTWVYYIPTPLCSLRVFVVYLCTSRETAFLLHPFAAECLYVAYIILIQICFGPQVRGTNGSLFLTDKSKCHGRFVQAQCTHTYIPTQETRVFTAGPA